MAQRHKDEPADVVRSIRRLLWRYRIELGLFTFLLFTDLLVAGLLGTTTGAVVMGVLGLALLINGRTRTVVMWWLFSAYVRRAFDAAVDKCSRGASGVTVKHVKRTPVGEMIQFKVRSGNDIAAMDAHAGKLAAALHVDQVRVSRDPAHPKDASRAQAVLYRRDPLDTGEPLMWPNVYAPELSLWDRIPMGVDEFDQTRYICLPQRHLLMGGATGSGKSVALSLIVATAALDPNVKLWLLDGKDYEMPEWAPCAEAFVGANGREAIEVLKAVQQEMRERGEALKANGKRHIEREDGLPLHLVVVDELPYYCNLAHLEGKTKQGVIISGLLSDLVARGRAPGIIVVAAAQKPAHDVIPTTLRDNFGWRYAFRCMTSEASDTILGSKAASQGYDASTIPLRDEMRGVGWLAAEEGHPVRVKGFNLTNDEVGAIARRAYARRVDDWGHELTLSSPVPVDPE